MSQVIGYSVLAIIVGVPVGAVACAYRDKVGLHLVRLGRALAFDPRHPALTYRSASKRRGEQAPIWCLAQRDGERAKFGE